MSTKNYTLLHDTQNLKNLKRIILTAKWQNIIKKSFYPVHVHTKIILEENNNTKYQTHIGDNKILVKYARM